MSINDLLARMEQAQTDEEKSWIIVEQILERLSPDERFLTFAVAVPHWFNDEIIAALCPELSHHSESLYRELQRLPFVEPFADRGHNIHKNTRKLILSHLYQTQRIEYQRLSSRMANYFSQCPTNSSWQIERLYHLAANPDWQADELSNLIPDWLRHFRYAEIESLLKRLFEQVEAQRTSDRVTAAILYGYGLAEHQLQNLTDAQRYYQQALRLYSQLNDNLGKAKTLSSLSDVFHNLNLSLGLHQEVTDAHQSRQDEKSLATQAIKSQAPKRQRGVILTQQGEKRLSEAIDQVAAQTQDGKRLSREKIAEITRFDISTVSMVLGRQKRVDRATLAKFFKAFSLELTDSDFDQPIVEAKPEKMIPVQEPVVIGEMPDVDNFFGRDRKLKQMTERTDEFIYQLQNLMNAFPEYEGILQPIIAQIQQGKVAKFKAALEQIRKERWGRLVS